MAEKSILVTGATGYVGGCLVPRLLEKGYRVRVLARDPSRLAAHAWSARVEVVAGDTLSQPALAQAMQGISTTYYLIHNMSSGRNYIEKEIESAGNFATAAAAAGVEHIVYLGGLANPDDALGFHMRSRLQTGDTLRKGSVPVTEFRASLVIGSGSISFEMIRYLVDQLPILCGPAWMHNHTQPISIQDVLEYLLAALENPACFGKTYEIGGRDVLTYADSMSSYARLRGLKRPMFTLPGLSMAFMARMAGLLTPVPARIAAPLLDGMRTDSVVRDGLARQDFPSIHPMDYESALAAALECQSPRCLEFVLKLKDSSFRIRQEGFLVEGQQVRVLARPGSVYQVLAGLGGERGWLYMDWLWKVRGWLDKLAGGPGLRASQKADPLAQGAILDFYRVELLEAGQKLLLKAELKAPGSGWMEWHIGEKGAGEVVLTQIAYFAPRGLAGFLYWYSLLPVHRLVFNGLIRAIARQAGELPQNS